MQTLTFQNITLTPAKVDKQIWLTSADLAKALEYSDVRSVTNIYNRNKDEFTSGMTTVIKLITNGINGSKRELETRIFSLRGCHLIAMFARTSVAKEFRKWVLDILDKEVGEPVQVKTTAADRTPLRQAVTALCGKCGLMHDEAYRLVHQYMGVEHIDEIAMDDLPRAVEYVHRLMMGGIPRLNIPFIQNVLTDNAFQIGKAQSELRSITHVVKGLLHHLEDIELHLNASERNTIALRHRFI
ncbi:MAG: BRO family protein [Moraxella sp.]|nr:BRO family protein [Moraxella sp.]